MEVTQEDNFLIIKIPMEEDPQLSSSGKTMSLASSKGNKPTDLFYKGQRVTVGVNAYFFPNKR